jgi:hypothetical protein
VTKSHDHRRRDRVHYQVTGPVRAGADRATRTGDSTAIQAEAQLTVRCSRPHHADRTEFSEWLALAEWPHCRHRRKNCQGVSVAPTGSREQKTIRRFARRWRPRRVHRRSRVQALALHRACRGGLRRTRRGSREAWRDACPSAPTASLNQEVGRRTRRRSARCRSGSRM